MYKETGPGYWLALARARGVSPLSARVLLDAFGGSARAVFDAVSAGEVVDGVQPRVCAALREFDDWGWVEDEIARADSLGVRIITLGDAAYPPLLAEIPDPPVVLYVKGAPERWAPAVAVVGTRRPSQYGSGVSERLSGELAAFGMVVTSGMARGCDTAAHRGALASGGVTVAVLGTGVDMVYPGENRGLAEEIAETGALVSEFPLGASPLPGNFPQRNRIIAGLSLGVVVVEAPERSGALMTARLALDYNRDVFAVPGPVTSAKSAGPNRLIKDGAMLAGDCADVLTGLGLASRHAGVDAGPAARPDSAHGKAGPVSKDGPVRQRGPVLGEDEALVWKSLAKGPLHIDSVSSTSGLTPSAASAVLLGLELKGLIEQLPGKVFSRKIHY